MASIHINNYNLRLLLLSNKKQFGFCSFNLRLFILHHPPHPLQLDNLLNYDNDSEPGLACVSFKSSSS